MNKNIGKKVNRKISGDFGVENSFTAHLLHPTLTHSVLHQTVSNLPRFILYNTVSPTPRMSDSLTLSWLPHSNLPHFILYHTAQSFCQYRSVSSMESIQEETDTAAIDLKQGGKVVKKNVTHNLFSAKLYINRFSEKQLKVSQKCVR